MKAKIHKLMLSFSLLLLSPFGLATDGSLTVKGSVIQPTCTALGVIADRDIGSAQPELSPVITLTGLSDYSNSGSSFLWFQIHFKNCYASASMKNIRVRMSSPYADSDGFLRNAIPSGAKGTAVVLYERNIDTGANQIMPIGKGRSGTSFRSLPAEGTVGYDGIFRFGFLATAHTLYNETITPGAFSTSVDYEMEYQ